MIWGIIKFSKRIIRPHAVTNNEVLDLLSRVPDDEELVKFIKNVVKSCFVIYFFLLQQIQYRELSLQPPAESARRDPRKKKQS